MTWVFILMDVLILAALIFLCVVVYLLWTRRKKLNKVSLSQFRNEELYEKSAEEMKRYAHIEDTLNSGEEEEVAPETVSEVNIEESEISFSNGYGGLTELGVNDEY